MSNAIAINNDTMQSMSIAHVSMMVFFYLLYFNIIINIFFEKKSPILSSCFSRDGESFAVSTLDNSLHIFNTNDVE